MPPWTGSRRKIARGNAGSTETVKAMTQLAYEGSIDPVVIKAAQDAIRLVPERDDYATFQAILADVRRRMRYTADPLDAEVVKHPRVAIQGSDDSPNGREPMDCDDVSTLAAAMLNAIGYQTRFVTVPADARRPKDWSHVYLVARTTAGKWVPLDPIMRAWPVGKEVPEAHLTGPRVYHGGSMSGIGVGPSINPVRGRSLEALVRALQAGLIDIDEFDRKVRELSGGGSRPNVFSRFRGGSMRGYGMGSDDITSLRMNAMAAGGLPQSAAFPAASGATPAAEGSWWRQGLDFAAKEGPGIAKAYLEARRKPAPIINKTVIRGQQGGGSPGFFSNPDGSTNWTNVAIVGGGAALVLFLVMKSK